MLLELLLLSLIVFNIISIFLFFLSPLHSSFILCLVLFFVIFTLTHILILRISFKFVLKTIRSAFLSVHLLDSGLKFFLVIWVDYLLFSVLIRRVAFLLSLHDLFVDSLIVFVELFVSIYNLEVLVLIVLLLVLVLEAFKFIIIIISHTPKERILLGSVSSIRVRPTSFLGTSWLRRLWRLPLIAFIFTVFTFFRLHHDWNLMD